MPKTAFSTPFGHYEWRVLGMGLTNSPATFMKAMTHAFSPLQAFVLVYLDDLLVMSKSADEHMSHLRQVFEVLRKHRLVAKPSKCHFFNSQVKYLGHIVSPEGITPDPAKIKPLLDWQYPTTVLGLQQFLGTANYFRKFIPNFSRIAAPLYRLTKVGVPFSNAPDYQLCFQTLKDLMVHPGTLAYPDPEKPYILIYDASITGCGAVLVQEDRPVAYFSAKYSSAVTNYTTGEQEMLGIIKALKEWRCYLEGAVALTIKTDHNPLIYFQTQRNRSRRQARLMEFLSRFQYTCEHIPGVGNPADALSRLYTPLAATLAIVTIAGFQSDFVQRLREAYPLDPGISADTTTPYDVQDGLYYLKGRIVVP
jgi:hypothetical protein